MRAQIRAAFLLLLAAAIGCSNYQNARTTKEIWSVKVTTNREDVKNCRRLGSVDTGDKQRGCGLTVQPSPQECLQYQVLLAGGDTLLANGYVGEAYQCAAPSPTTSEIPAAPTPSTAPATPAAPAAPASAPAPFPSPAPTPTSTPVTPATPVTPVLPKTSPTPASSGGSGSGSVRLVQSRDAVKGCVYLADIDLRAECPVEGTGTPISCIAERAARAGGNAVFVEGNRASIFSCKAGSTPVPQR